MHPYFQAFFVAAAFSALLPAAAADFLSPAQTQSNDQIQLAVEDRRQLASVLAANSASALPFLKTSRPSGIVDDCSCFSEQSSAMRWLYSAVSDKRTFISYTPSRPGRPAELRFSLKLSLL